MAIGHRSDKMERILVGGFLLLICLSLAHFLHEAWFYAYGQISTNASATGASGTFDVRTLRHPWYAPEAYRVLMPAVTLFAVATLRLKDLPAILTAIDFFSAFGTLYLLYRILARGLLQQGREPGALARWLTIALYLALIHFPVLWITPWMRSETLPTSFLLAFALYCLTRAADHPLWYLPFLIALGVQSLARSDAPFIFALSFLLLSLFCQNTEGLGPRRLNIVFGLLATLLVGGIQLYMQMVLYPNRIYPPGTNQIQIEVNLYWHQISNLLLALLPYLAFALLLLIKRPRLDAVDRLILLSAALYLPLWFTFGVVDEVRIYVPYLFLLSMTTAKVVGALLADTASRQSS